MTEGDPVGAAGGTPEGVAAGLRAATAGETPGDATGGTPVDPLQDPGLRDRPAHLAVRVVALAYLSHARQALDRWGASGHRDDLHALRVALRRLRSWVRVHRSWLRGSVGRRDRRALRRLARATGGCRDLDVQLDKLASMEDLPPEG
jgi:hypothetical protein